MGNEVSVITVKRAYLELERDGVIAAQHGRGSVVAEGAEIGARIHEEELERTLDQAARLASRLGVSTKDLQSRLRAAAERLAPAVKERA